MKVLVREKTEGWTRQGGGGADLSIFGAWVPPAGLSAVVRAERAITRQRDTASLTMTLAVPVVGVLGAMALVGDRPRLGWWGFALVLAGGGNDGLEGPSAPRAWRLEAWHACFSASRRRSFSRSSPAPAPTSRMPPSTSKAPAPNAGSSGCQNQQRRRTTQNSGVNVNDRNRQARGQVAAQQPEPRPGSWSAPQPPTEDTAQHWPPGPKRMPA
ncbi:hypothetical protein FQR65_LT15465 [Abscondita terminalis]|nr:hypothetical protein FQR65_LT15465 [Abscondita terminalis]